jgi:urease accessory protein
MNRAVTALLPLLLVIATPAHAHTGTGIVHGFTAGFLHPLLGLDHLLAMVTVGLWAGCVGARALWAWPLAFVTVMLLGALVGLGGWAIPQAEILIGLTVVALGLAAAMQLPLSVALGAGICGLFALVHGYAHGAELPAGADASGYMVGFALATALLHAAGLALGLALSRLDRIWLPGLSGGAVAATGLVLLLG